MGKKDQAQGYNFNFLQDVMYSKEFTEMHETAQEVLNEAHELFYEKGYEKASMREIAERVGISKAAMYHHFANKEEILYTICLQAGEMIKENMRRAISRNMRTEMPLKEQLTNILFKYTSSYIKNKNFNKILLYDIESLPFEKKRGILDMEKDNVHQLRSYLQEQMDMGRLKPCNLTVLTFCLFGSVHWLYFWYKDDKALSLRDVVRQIVDIHLNGVLAPQEQTEAEGRGQS
ncbi:MAG: TetR/AcrR family transcriptional regulator [Desulfohalobiaceae bacterium]